MAGGEGRGGSYKSSRLGTGSGKGNRVTSKTAAKTSRVSATAKTTAKTSRLPQKAAVARGRDAQKGTSSKSIAKSSSKSTKKKSDPWKGLRTVTGTGKSSGSKANSTGGRSSSSSFKSNISSQRR